MQQIAEPEGVVAQQAVAAASRVGAERGLGIDVWVDVAPRTGLAAVGADALAQPGPGVGVAEGDVVTGVEDGTLA